MRIPFKFQKKMKTIKDEMARIPGVVSASSSNFSFTNGISNIAMLPEGAADNEITSEATIGVDADFIPNFGLDLLAGRNFQYGNISDDTSAFIVNEAAVRQFNWGAPEDAIGKSIDWGLGKKGSVIGVIKDFNFSSLHTEITPLIVHVVPDWYSYITLRVDGKDISTVIKQAEQKYKQFDNENPFSYAFMDADFASLYEAEEQTRTIVGLLTSLAIFIACLGLFGLAAFIAEQRTKEIGIRKVLGANVGGIIVLMSKDFLLLIAVSFVLAVPAAWYAGTQWLTGFAFKTDIAWWIFAVSGVGAAAVALLTVSFQSVKASMMNPVKALRTE